jgi:2-polyprenyl-3-methyl-5-hydroxy-6-metoxy-1,4-benzoquinol methylase
MEIRKISETLISGVCGRLQGALTSVGPDRYMNGLETLQMGRHPALGSVAFSCVVDKDPLLAAQCFIWLNCLIEIQSVPPAQIFVHHTGIGNADFAIWLKSRRVNLVEITPYDRRNPHCNKLRQLETFARKTFDRVVLMDCDTAWIGDAPLPIRAPIAAKIVDFANPPEAILAAIFREAGLGEPCWAEVSFPQGPGARYTDRNNCNGGLYILAGALIPELAVAWRKWADWCLDRRHLFGGFAMHVDQVSFALALRELGRCVDPLPIEWNYPLVPGASFPDVVPQIIHFHRQIGPHCKLGRIGVAKPDQAIDALNRHITAFLAAQFVNSVFWDLRYRVAPELGSGVGSRGESLAAKRKWLGHVLGTFADKTVVDVGCGDLEVMRALPLAHYRGLDVSEQALEIARAKRPDWHFARLGADHSALPEGDAVVCLDVLIHQKQASEFEALLRRLVEAARERLIVSGYDEPPRLSSEIVAFHRPLLAALRETGAFAEISVVGRYRDCSLIVADKPRPRSAIHPNDMAAEDFNQASQLTPRPDLLRHLADLSRQTFGFYTKHFARALEYPWIAHKLETLPPGRRVLDIGAGLNPLPLFLARRGAIVECIDPHPLQRTPPTDHDWNEWGFYDYSRHHQNLRSHHADARVFEPDAPLDIVYSVGVIAHMPRAVWEAVLARCRRWLCKGGRLLLTIDLFPGTQVLWNRSEGREIEAPARHGDIAAFAGHLGRLGFTPVEAFIWQRVPHSRTDLLFIDCVAN